MRRVELVRDESIEPGKIKVGGVRIVQARTDEELGRALRTARVACHPETYDELRAFIDSRPDLEVVR